MVVEGCDPGNMWRSKEEREDLILERTQQDLDSLCTLGDGKWLYGFIKAAVP